ncbi:MAG: hypothetical protein ACOYOB_19305, partial [Myxococcota bacterium]
CKLGPIDQCVVTRKYLDAWPDDRIAVDCGLPTPDAVRQRLSRAMKELRTMVGTERGVAYNPLKRK